MRSRPATSAARVTVSPGSPVRDNAAGCATRRVSAADAALQTSNASSVARTPRTHGNAAPYAAVDDRRQSTYLSTRPQIGSTPNLIQIRVIMARLGN
jgi:hypothetical protein